MEDAGDEEIDAMADECKTVIVQLEQHVQNLKSIIKDKGWKP